MTLPRLAGACAVLAVTVALAGCSPQTEADPPVAAVSTPPASTAPTPELSSQAPNYDSAAVTTREMSADGLLTDFYVEGQTATLRVPPTKGPAPLVVVVPGGGWRGVEPMDYRPLVESLTASGMTTSLITYDTMSNGAQFPLPIDDVACAVRWSAFQLNALGYPPSQVIVAGHSAGGQLAAEVALTGDRFGADCPMPPVKIDGLVGLAGVYELSDHVLAPPELFPDGGSDEERAQYSPLSAASDSANQVPPMNVLLLTGVNDTTVPATQAEQMAAALRTRGINPTVNVLPLEHNMGFPLALEIAPIIKAWILGDAYTPTPTPTPVASPPPVDPASPAPAPAASAPPPAPASPAASVPASPPAG